MPPVWFWGTADGLVARTPLGFVQRRRLITTAGLSYDASEWSGALVVVERGVLELEWSEGACLRFEPGDTLCLSRLGLRALRSGDAGPTVLVVVSRGREGDDRNGWKQ